MRGPSTTDFLPEFFDEEPADVTLLPAPPPTHKEIPAPEQREIEPDQPRADRGEAFRMKVRLFTCTLTRQRRAEVTRRSRFHSMPWLRRADEFDPDDQLP